MEYILIQDDDCHWYVIPADREKDFSKWCDSISNDADTWDTPKYAKEVGGSYTLVKFKQYRIE